MGSQIMDLQDGVLRIRSGGGVVDFDGGDDVYFRQSITVGDQLYGRTLRATNWVYAPNLDTSNAYVGSMQLGGVWRSSWPSVSVHMANCGGVNDGSWKYCWCPGGYNAVGMVARGCNGSDYDTCGSVEAYWNGAAAFSNSVADYVQTGSTRQRTCEPRRGCYWETVPEYGYVYRSKTRISVYCLRNN
jgi:hypothetical protein